MMPFKSIAQRDKLKDLAAAGKYPQADWDKLEAETDLATLPDRLHPKKEVSAVDQNKGAKAAE